MLMPQRQMLHVEMEDAPFMLSHGLHALLCDVGVVQHALHHHLCMPVQLRQLRLQIEQDLSVWATAWKMCS